MTQKILAFCFILFLTITCHADQLIIEPDMGRTPILSAIENAKSSIDLVMYGFTDFDFVTSLINAQKNKKNIHVLIEKSPYNSDGENDKAISKLNRANIAIQNSNPEFQLTHQKTFIFDNQKAIVMTFNLTRSAFKDQRNFALVINDPAMVKEIENVFQADWEHKKINVSNPNLVWSPNNSREKLLAFIRSAKSNLEIYAQSISDYDTIGALAKAARHGVNVEILTSDKPSYKNQKKYDYLTRAGVKILFSKKYYIHAKVIIVDHRAALIGSMNLSKPSIEENRELSVITNNLDTINQLEKTFQQDSH